MKALERVMKMVNINMNVPETLDEYYRAEAKRRLTSKSSVMREVLANHVRQHAPEVKLSRRNEGNEQGEEPVDQGK